jgi:deoxyhypusine monooxygenase
MSNQWNLLVNEMAKPEVSEYGSVDPAPAQDSSRIEVLQTTLLDEKEVMFKRMRAVFALRNIRSHQAIDILCEGFSSKSALLKHELAYVLGQMQDSRALDTLVKILEDENEHVMVRHEAAEAMGAIGDNSIKEVLEKHLNDSHIEVSESCEVALDLLAYYSDR